MRKALQGVSQVVSLRLLYSNLNRRSKKETERLHRLAKPERVRVKDDLPSIHSDDESDDGEEWSSGLELSEDGSEVMIPNSEDESGEDSGEDTSLSTPAPRRREKKLDSDEEEMPYETAPRTAKTSWDSESEGGKGIERLPIKLSDGRVKKSEAKVFLHRDDEESAGDTDEEPPEPPEPTRVEDVATGARFGRAAVVDVVSTKSRKARVQAAKEQIAGICQEIVSDPENSVCGCNICPEHS